MARWLLAAIIAALVADSALAEIAIRRPSPSAVVGATRTLTEGATGCPELERLLAMATLLKGGNPHAAIQLFHEGRCIKDFYFGPRRKTCHICSIRALRVMTDAVEKVAKEKL